MATYKVMSRTKYSSRVNGSAADIHYNLDLSRFDLQTQKAQYALDNAVMTSMVPLMPMQTGTFINRTRGMSAALAGSGKVVAAAPPMGRYLYEGKTMVDPLTGSTFARPGVRKVLVSQFGGKTNARENLTFGRPGAVAHWFEVAKQRDGKSWIRQVKRIAGGGQRG